MWDDRFVDDGWLFVSFLYCGGYWVGIQNSYIAMCWLRFENKKNIKFFWDLQFLWNQKKFNSFIFEQVSSRWVEWFWSCWFLWKFDLTKFKSNIKTNKQIQVYITFLAINLSFFVSRIENIRNAVFCGYKINK